jgi:hypothetical protein
MAADKMKLNLTTSSVPASAPCGRDFLTLLVDAVRLNYETLIRRLWRSL